MISLFFEQLLNGIQFGMMLFLMAAGLTLIFGVMGVINLAHGSLFMIGAYAAAGTVLATGSVICGLLAAIVVTGLLGVVLERLVFHRLYARTHLDQVLATFALTLIFNGAARWLFGRQPYQIDIPSYLSGTVAFGDVEYPVYRFVFIVFGILLVALMYFVLAKTRAGMLVRAGSTNPVIAAAMGANLPLLFTFIFAVGAIFAGIAGALVGPIQAVDAGMGESAVVLAFLVIVLGGVGSVRGAFLASLAVGMIDTLSRSFLPMILRAILEVNTATTLAAILAPIAIYILVAGVLLFKPLGIMGGKV
jgi:branched-chain amino acid transport system permease protein